MAAGPQVLGARRDEFDVPPGIAYFNTANIGPLPHRVREAGEAALERRARPWTIAAEDWFADVERLRELVARLIGADPEGVALVPATSYAFAVAVRNLELREGERIVVLAEEYPSGIYSWQELAHRSGAEIVTVSRESGGDWTAPVLAALDERVRVLSVPHVHWTDGALLDVAAVADRARALGARVVVDASQSLGALPLDLAAVQPDFLCTVGYKWLLGPLGLSYLYVAPQWREGEPIEQNWINRAGSEDFAGLVEYTDEYQPGARRFDVGQHSNFSLVPMAVAALEQLLDWEVPRIAATLAETTAQIERGARELGLGAIEAHRRGPHMLGVRLPEQARSRATETLAAAGCSAALRGDSLRIAPHLHNTPEEVERLLGALAELA